MLRYQRCRMHSPYKGIRTKALKRSWPRYPQWVLCATCVAHTTLTKHMVQGRHCEPYTQ